MRIESPERREHSEAHESPPESIVSDFTRLVVQHAAQMERQFACAAAGGVCETCHERGSSLAVQLTWSAVYYDGSPLVSSVLDLVQGFAWRKGRYQTTEFSTYHSFCSRCASKIHRRITIGEMIRLACLGLFALSLLALILGVVFSSFLLVQHATRRGIGFSLLALGGGLIWCVVASVGITLARSWWLPKALCDIGKRPFFLDSIQTL